MLLSRIVRVPTEVVTYGLIGLGLLRGLTLC